MEEQDNKQDSVDNTEDIIKSRQQMEIDFHNQFAENYNSLTSTVVSLIITALAVLWGYGYVFLGSNNDLSLQCFFKMKSCNEDIYTLNALLFTNFASMVVLFCSMHIMIVQGGGLRREQFIVNMLRKKYKFKTKPGINITGSYNPYGKQCINILPGLYKEMVVIFFIFSVLLSSITTIRIGLSGADSGGITCVILLAILLPYLICYSVVWCSLACQEEKYMKTQKEYLIYR